MSLPNVPHAAEHIATAAWHGIVGMAIVNPDGVLTAANPRLCHVLEYTERELSGKHFREITAPSDQITDEVEFGLLVSGQIDHYELAKTWVSKRQRMIAGNLFVQRMETGEIVFAVAQVVESSSPEQSAAITCMVRAMMIDILDKKGLTVAREEVEDNAPWYRNTKLLIAVGTVWPAIAFFGWVIFQIAKLIDPS